jgi:hypothetical protein
LRGETSQKSNLQILKEPLHDTKVVHHLHKGDEKDDGTQNVGEEPALIDNGILIEEEDGTDSGLLQEVRGEESKPPEEFETSASLKDEEGDCLLEK